MAKATGAMASLEDIFVKKAPALPKNVKDFLVKYASLFAIIGVVIYGLGILSLLGIGALFSPFAAVAGSTSFFQGVFWGILTLALEGGLLLLAVPGLKARKMVGWNMLFYSQIVGIIANIVAFNIVSAVLSFVIGFYFLFQIRSYYK